jgi:hypothetical protein
MSSRQPALVVAGWVAGNAALAGLLAGFGETAFAVALYAASAALPALVALAVWGVPAANSADEFTLGGGSAWVLPAALGLVLVGLGAVLGIWFVLVGAAVVLFSLVRLLRAGVSTEEAADGRR